MHDGQSCAFEKQWRVQLHKGWLTYVSEDKWMKLPCILTHAQRHFRAGSDLLECVIILWWLCHLEGVILHSLLELLKVHPAQGLKAGAHKVKCTALHKQHGSVLNIEKLRAMHNP